MQLDDDQKRAVEWNSNAVVAAGAGSGKTRVLALRFLRLVREGHAKVDGVLTLTFTRKAAAEMRERIYSLLLDDRSHPLVAAALQDFEKSTIATLDSFCSQVIRSGGRQLGIPQSFQVDEQALASLALRESYLFVLENHEKPSIRRLVYTHGFANVQKEFFASLAKKEFSLSGTRDFLDDLRFQIGACEKTIREGVPALCAIFSGIRELVPSGKVMENAQDSAGLFLEAMNRVMSGAGRKDSCDYDMLESVLAGYSLKKSTSKQPDVELYNDFKKQADQYAADVLSAVRFLGERSLYEELAGLVNEFRKRFLAKKRATGILGYPDLLDMAIHILSGDKKLRSYYTQKFSYIMIDEFQDNNRLQKDLLYLLAGNPEKEHGTVPGAADISAGKLFFVGDEKQSIYLFRGADVRVFKGLGSEITAAGGELIRLGTNYRSHPRLVAFFNDIFPRIMENSGESYEAGFSALMPGRKADTFDDRTSSLGIYYLPYSPESESRECLDSMETEAYVVADYIRKAVSGKGPLLSGEDGTVMVPDYSDIALLMRSSSNQIHFERVFRQMGIPYTTQNVRSLFLEAPVNDIYGLLQLATVPDDRFAYAVYLRSPFAGLSDDCVVELLCDEQKPFEREAAGLGLDEHEAAKYLCAKNILVSVREMIDVVPIHRIVQYLWFDLGYRYHLLRDPAWHGYLEFIDYLVDIARQFDLRNKSMVMFLGMISENLGEYKKMEEDEVLKDAGNSVRIMSVHASKGLEFPVVIFAATGQAVNDKSGYSPYYTSENSGLSVNLSRDAEGKKINPFYDNDREMRKKLDLAELKRLVYVALTRAESHLVVTGSHNRNNRNREDVPLNLILSGLGAREDPSAHPLVTTVGPVSRRNYRQGLVRTGRKDPLERAKNCLLREKRTVDGKPGRIAVTALNRLYMEKFQEASGMGIRTRLPGLSVDNMLSDTGKEMQFGSLVHWVCEHTLRGDYDPGEIPAHFARGFTAMQMKNVIADAERLAGRIPGELVGLLHGNRAYYEEPFAMIVKGEGGHVFLEGQFDLYVETPEETLLYDFKSDIDMHPSGYGLQLAVYREALSCIRSKPVRAFLVYLRSGELVACTSGYEDYPLLELLGLI